MVSFWTLLNLLYTNTVPGLYCCAEQMFQRGKPKYHLFFQDSTQSYFTVPSPRKQENSQYLTGQKHHRFWNTESLDSRILYNKDDFVNVGIKFDLIFRTWKGFPCNRFSNWDKNPLVVQRSQLQLQNCSPKWQTKGPLRQGASGKHFPCRTNLSQCICKGIDSHRALFSFPSWKQTRIFTFVRMSRWLLIRKTATKKEVPLMDCCHFLTLGSWQELPPQTSRTSPFPARKGHCCAGWKLASYSCHSCHFPQSYCGLLYTSRPFTDSVLSWLPFHLYFALASSNNPSRFGSLSSSSGGFALTSFAFFWSSTGVILHCKCLSYVP